MKILCVGIDPSINSTGVCMTLFNEYFEEQFTKFYIIHPHKLTKKEKSAEESNNNFQYVTFEEIIKDLSQNHPEEIFKTYKLFYICQNIKRIIELEEFDDLFVCIEGISYGSSLRTKSIFDLAGLNYLLRNIVNELRGKLLVYSPANIKKFATGKGNANKEEMVEAFKIAYPNLCLPKLDDVADAFFMKEISKSDFIKEYLQQNWTHGPIQDLLDKYEKIN
ncbi:MAG: hypothetical protein J1F35_03280 [Erysipelotrichales bacterium]|nr:hypothetical protein [Erysipelotrichales bacterium]